MSKLTVKNLSFGYDNNKLFSNLNFNVPSGSFISIIGPNGSGKSSLAQILVGKIKTNNVYIDDINIFDDESFFKKIGYFSTNNDINIDNVYDYIAFTLKNINLLENDINKKVVDIANRFNISYLLDSNISELSTFDKYLVYLSSIFIYQPKIVVLDDPFIGLDKYEREKLFNSIKSYNDDNKITIINVTNNMEDLLYGSTAVVRYTVDVTNTSLYNDTNTVSILFYVPDGFTCDTKSVSAVGIGENNKKQKLNVTNITSLTADTIDTYSDEFLSGEAIKKIQGKENGSEQPTSAIAVTVQVKDDDSHYVLPTNGSIKININTTKLLGNDEEMSYGADAEILSYSNDSYKRIEYKAKASSSAVSQVAVAGNASTKEKDYTKTSNKGIILLPTGGDKRMLKQRILLVILVSACGIIIYKLKKSEKDKHNK